MGSIQLAVDTPEGFVALAQNMELHWFRGHGDASWKLASTLERLCDQLNVPADYRRDHERMMIAEFQRGAHHFDQSLPPQGRVLEWAALMQHYGAPTRLLDVTRSPYAALFFALERTHYNALNKSDSGARSDAAVWAFNLGPLAPANEPDGSSKPNDSSISRAEQCFNDGEAGTGVFLARPYSLNDRIARQQGGFIMPERSAISFEQQLSKTLGCNVADPKLLANGWGLKDLFFPKAIKIVIPAHAHAAMKRFLKKANVTATTLFGGLDGYARSFHQMLAAHEAYA